MRQPLGTLLRYAHLAVEGIVAAEHEPCREVALDRWAEVDVNLQKVLMWVRERHRERIAESYGKVE